MIENVIYEISLDGLEQIGIMGYSHDLNLNFSINEDVMIKMEGHEPFEATVIGFDEAIEKSKAAYVVIIWADKKDINNIDKLRIRQITGPNYLTEEDKSKLIRVQAVLYKRNPKRILCWAPYNSLYKSTSLFLQLDELINNLSKQLQE